MASSTESTEIQYSESVDENLKQIQSRRQAERAKIKNAASRLKSNAMYAVKGYMNLKGVSKVSDEASDESTDDTDEIVAEQEKQVMSGNMELPDGVDNMVNACAQAATQGYHPKMLSWEPYSDKLSVPALNKAWDMGLIDEDNERHQRVGDIEAKYAGTVVETAQNESDTFVPKTIKVLPELNEITTKDFLSSSFEMADAMSHAGDYLVNDESQLQNVFEASNMGMSEEEVAAASDGLVHENIEPDHSDRVAKAAEFASYVQKNGMDMEMDSMQNSF